jgi:predicted amidophosphoribosyltransferase
MCALTVDEASETYASAMRNVLPAGPGVCATCKCFLEPGWTRCFKCNNQLEALDLVVPITYSEHLGQMHTALRSYKSAWSEEERKYAGVRLVAILWRFLSAHEVCLVRALGIEAFDVVTTVPSSTRLRDESNRLRPIVRACGPVRDRFERLLLPAEGASDTREFDAERYVPERQLDSANVLLIDDTWASGVHAQSAAYALQQAGAATVCLVVIGRHVQPTWTVGEKTSEELLKELPRTFDWDRCAVHVDR